MLKLFTVIVTEAYEAANPKAYRVRAPDAGLALAHARTVFSAHSGSKGSVLFVMEGAPVFLPIYARDDFPDKGVIDLGTAQFEA
ncbi:hypothetical protein KABACHOK_02490 [Brevundimonas phage vB_BpoS-Kabachok]|uniref:Uncharacterized protein n=1 Tax=Brevundimonas phage vB_BpoS-Kabachok TaxID=2948600 RepID=A0A9E7MPC0_9CAUD|nr:hypothetical protein KABACHOK_02490 [Brevundimonas phage vB_BpoS-Kabachok]